MSGGNTAKDPRYLTRQQKKSILYPLYRRSRHLDRKWSIRCSIPDDAFTYFAILPYVGGILSTSLAVGYIKKMHETFKLPDTVDKQLYINIVKNAALSIIPGLGWILRRIYRVNRRNYLLLEKYILESASKEEANGTDKNIPSNSSATSSLINI